jgi:hypothetical protein
MAMAMSAQGAAIEPCVLDPLGHDCRGEWGHLGPMDFGVRVGNLDAAAAALAAAGVRLHGRLQSVDVGTGEWRYVYIEEPDGNYVQLVEARY